MLRVPSFWPFGKRALHAGGFVNAKYKLNGIRVINSTGSSIGADKLVAVLGFDTTTGLPKIVLADADVATHVDVYVTATAIAASAKGFVFKGGLSSANLNTNSASAAGDPVYLDITAGGFAHTAPSGADDRVIPVGWVTVKSATVGRIHWHIGESEKSGEDAFQSGMALTSPIVSGDLGVLDNVSIELGTDDDSVLRHVTAVNNANAALTDVLIGTPVTQATAANSLIISNVTASGDILVAANRGGASEEYFFADSSAGTLTLTGPGGIVAVESGTTPVITVNSATVIEVGDDINFTLGADNDGVLRHKTTSTNANTVVTGAIVGTPVVPALAANSVVLSNITADGDIALITQTAGNSQAALTVDASAGQVDLYAAGVSKLTIDSTGARVRRSVEIATAQDTITAAECGRVFFLNSGTEFALTLPAPALGLEYTFIVTAAPATASYTVVTEGGCQVMAGHVLSVDLAGTDSGTDVEGTATGTTITFVDGVSLVGDRAHVISDGTSWFASCVAGHPSGITITG